MRRSRRDRTLISSALVALVLASASLALADGVDPRYLQFRLSLLPEVTAHTVDDQGHLVRLAGRLTPPGPSPAREVVPGFLRIHRTLYPAAPGTAYRVEWATAIEEGTEVAVRQEVDGFASEGLIRGVVNAEGELILLEGVVLHGDEGGGEGLTGRTVDEAEAYRLALAAAFRGPGDPPPLDRFEERAATRFVDSNLRRTWRVELVRRAGSRPLRHTVTLDAVTGAVVRRVTEDLGHLVGVDSRRETTPAEDAKVFTILGCEPAEPPIGDFTTPEGVDAWPQTRLTWAHEGGPPAAGRFTAAASLENGDYGSIFRSGVVVPSRHRRVRLHFPSLATVTTFKLRWGLTDARAVVFTAPQDCSRPPCQGTDVSVTLYLDDHPYWPPAEGAQLRLHVLTKEATGTVDRVDLLPGAFLELAGEPRLLAGGSIPDRYMAGTSFELWQPVVNNGCELRFTGGDSQRAVTYSACRDGNPSLCAQMWCNLDVEDPDPTATISGSLPAGALATYRLCTLFLPPPSAEVEGPWTLTGAFADPSKQPEAFSFHVDNGLLPDVFFHKHLTSPLYAFSGTDRLERITTGQPFSLSVPLKSDAEPAFNVPLQIWARARMPGVEPTTEPWELLADTVLDVVDTWGPMVDLHGLVVEPALVNGLGCNWALLDLKVVLNPDHTIPESDYENNSTELLEFIPVAVDDMSFLGRSARAHWEDFSDQTYEVPWSPWGVDATVHPDLGQLRLKFDWTANHDNPFLHWYNFEEVQSVGGVMIRYRRVEFAGGDPYLIAGAWWGLEGNFVRDYDIPANLGGGEDTKHYLDHSDWQWHTVVWRYDLHEPFGSWVENPKLAFPMGVVEPEAPGDPFTHLYLAPDTRCFYHISQCVDAPETELDFIAYWKKEPDGQPTWDAFPTKMLYEAPMEALATLPGVLGPGVTLTMALEVQATHGHAVSAGQVGVTLTEAGGQPVTMTVTGPDTPTAGIHIFSLGEWTPTLTGESAFDVRLTTPDNNTGNNNRVFTVHVGECIPAVDLP